MPNEGKPKNKQARFEKRHADAGLMHNFDLHDEDGHDDATGKKIDNSSTQSNPLEVLSTVETSGDSDDVLGALPEEDDAAAKWLRENDRKKSSS